MSFNIASHIASRTFIIALVIWREARGEPYLGKVAVGEVVENRVLDPRWPETYPGVIFQPLQFSAFNPNDANAIKFPSNFNDSEWEQCWSAAQIILDTPYEFTSGANHYYNPNIVNPSWAKDVEPILVIGNHRFLKL